MAKQIETIRLKNLPNGVLLEYLNEVIICATADDAVSAQV